MFSKLIKAVSGKNGTKRTSKKTGDAKSKKIAVKKEAVQLQKKL